MSSAVKNILASFSTTPNDKKHFPATNQAHYCWYDQPSNNLFWERQNVEDPHVLRF